jgi:hypothetical protein
MRTFLFENFLVDEVVARWVGDPAHSRDPEVRKVLDTHEVAARTGLKEDADKYEQALKALWVVRPWDCGNIGLDLFPRGSSVLVG